MLMLRLLGAAAPMIPATTLLLAAVTLTALPASAAPLTPQAPATPQVDQADTDQAPARSRGRARAQRNAAAAAQPAATPGPMDPVTERPGLPRVLLIGDSISIGYTVPVRQLLADEANVLRPRTNCGPTTRGLEQIDAWLGEGPWDVIHFNWGLHDLKYMGPEGENLADPAAPDSRQQVPIDQYQANLEQLVQRLKKTGAQLIWCSTTPVPPGSSGRVVGDAKKYNDAARQVMQRHGVAINDLYAAAKPRLQQIQRPANVHFTTEGSAELAEHVAKAIRQALQQKKATKAAD